MKICPKCKKLYESEWQVCRTCQVDLKRYKKPIYIRRAVRLSVAAISLVALLPFISLLIVHAHVEKHLPSGWARILPILTNSISIGLGAAVLLFGVFFIFKAMIIEDIHPDVMVHEHDHPAG